MNSVLNSLSSSPIAQVMLKDVSLDDYAYQLQSALPAGTREKVALDIPTVDFNKKVSLDLPKYGLLQGIVLKIGIIVAGEGSDYVKMAQNFLLLLKSAVLSGHSREICELNGISNFAKILEMDYGTKQAILNASLNSISSLDDEDTPIEGRYYLYIPLFFPFFDRLNTLIDMEFTEPLNLSFTLGPEEQIFSNASLSGIDPNDSQVILYYLQMSENDVRQRQNAVFSLEKPTSIMSFSSYPEVPWVSASTLVSTTTTGVVAPQEAVIKLNTPNLLVSTTIIVRCTKDGSNGLTQALLPIDTIEFKGNGKSLYKYNFLEFALENCIFSEKKGSYRMNIYAPTTDKIPYENVFTHYWSLANSPEFFSGGVSGKNMSDFSAIVKFTPPVATTKSSAQSMAYTVEVVHQYVSIVSYSGNSGKIGVSMAL
jgi:hypothetical protein